MGGDVIGGLVRLQDWRARLAAYLGGCARQAFRPGTHDCALFAAGGVEAMTGRDLVADWRGQYRTLEAGRAALQAAGFDDHVALAASLLPEIAPARAAVGDVAVVAADGGGKALGIVQGAAVYCLHPTGLALVSRMEIERAFKV